MFRGSALERSQNLKIAVEPLVTQNQVLELDGMFSSLVDLNEFRNAVY